MLLHYFKTANIAFMFLKLERKKLESLQVSKPYQTLVYQLIF